MPPTYTPPPPTSELQRQQAAQQQGLGNRGIDLSQQQLGIQRGALGRQKALLPQYKGLADQALNIEQGALGRQLPLLQNSAQIQQGRWLASAGDLNRGVVRGFQNEWGNSAARGATNAGMGDRLGDISYKYARGLQDMKLDQMAYMLGYGENVAQLQDDISRLGLKRQQGDLTFQDQVAGLGDREAMLDIMSQRLGLNREELAAQTQATLDALAVQDYYSNLSHPYIGGM